MRYLFGFIIGALLVGAFQYQARSNDLDKSTKHMLSMVERAVYTGCLTGFKANSEESEDSGASEEAKRSCKEYTKDYMDYLKKLNGEAS